MLRTVTNLEQNLHRTLINSIIGFIIIFACDVQVQDNVES